MSPATGDATTALLRALRHALGIANFVNFDRVLSREWASITFTGARHEVTVRLTGDDANTAADSFVAGLDATEFRLRGHLLADIVLVGREQVDGGVRLHLEALTVEDG